MATVEERLAALEEQVAALTDRTAEAPPTKGVFWALNGLKSRVPDGPGAVLYTGTVRLGAEENYDWQYGRSVQDLLADDWSDLVGALTALAHPVRLRLLREILGGRRSASELAEIDGLGTTGQLYHHLRQLTAAGWLRTAGRARFMVPPERVVPLLAALVAVRR